MLNEIKDSIKARLYDMKYTPFLASYSFFFIYFNAKLFLIFFDSSLSVQNKIDILSYDMVNYCYPIAGALIYTLVFPFAQIGFYSAKLWFDKQMNSLKHNIEKKILLSLEESQYIRFANKKLQDELDDYIKRFEQTKKEYEDYKVKLEEEYQTKKDSLDSSFKERVNEANKNLNLEIHTANSVIVDKTTEIENLQKQINSLTKEKENLQKSKEIKNISNKISNNEETISLDTIIQTLNDDEKIVLETFFQNDSNMDKNKFKNILFDIKKMQKVTSEKTIQSLISKRILEDNSLYVILTSLGLELVDKLFRGKI